MSADEMTFGVEIECTIPRATCPSVGGYHCGTQIAGMPTGWNAQHDSSIRTGNGLRGVEIVSPILKGEDGLNQLKIVCDWLKLVGAKVNRSTGLHVHIGVDHTPENLKRIVTAAANFEKAIYASTGTKARERGNYCRTVQGSLIHRRGELSSADRYRVLNVMTRGHTVEFRAFAGSTNFAKIVGYVRLSVAIVEKALTVKKLPPWTAKEVVQTSPIKRGGDGLTTLNRFFYWSGWTRGREPKVYGMVGKNVGPSVKAMKKQLVTLARKYDAAV